MMYNMLAVLNPLLREFFSCFLSSAEESENLNDSLNLPVPDELSPPVQPIKIDLRGPTASIVPRERGHNSPGSVITSAMSAPSLASTVISRMGVEGKPEEVWQKFLKR